MVKGDYSSDVTMKMDVWQKDMTIIADFAREIGCPTPLFAATAPLYLAALAMGRSDEDSGAVCAVLEEMAHVKSHGGRRCHGSGVTGPDRDTDPGSSPIDARLDPGAPVNPESVRITRAPASCPAA